uniref:ERVV2 protein n=1 Tax=Sphaeramia orbicularis TaxID=375764 RepID=A0A673ACK4_9TELE
MWGLPKLAHYIDDIAVDLEDVTKSMTEGFSAVSAEIKALKNVALQNRAALDYMLASSGGVCHIIGQECCTFIPDVSGNLTYVVDHLNELLIRLTFCPVSIWHSFFHLATVSYVIFYYIILTNPM